MVHQLRSLRPRLTGTGPALLAGAHSGLSARLVEEAGFDGVWASGFEISAARGIPDANILTMAEVLESAAQIAQATSLPVIADCDNGFGNAINVIRTVKDYEREGIAGVCIEDNIFPKRCSFYAGVRRELASVEEHAGKVRAALDARRSDDFLIIARTEALIAGWGLDEALRRAEAYADAGADALLIHSKADTHAELEAFSARWDRPTPLVAVPTIYKDTEADVLDSLGYKLIIFANHALRSSVKAMQETLAELKRARRPAAVEDRVVPLAEVYRLVGVAAMKEQERRFLPAGTGDIRAVILAAGEDENLLPLTSDRPKCMLDVKGRSILERQVAALNEQGIRRIAVVRGYKKDAIDLPNIRYFDNDDYAATGEARSLMCARDFLRDRVVVLYGDVLFEGAVLEKLLRSQAAMSLVVDRSWREHRGAGVPGTPDLVRLTGAAADASRRMSFGEGAALKELGRKLDPEHADGEFIGLMMLAPEATASLLALWDELSTKAGAVHEAASPDRAALTDLIGAWLARGHAAGAVEISKGWMEVDSFDDYRSVWARSESGAR